MLIDTIRSGINVILQKDEAVIRGIWSVDCLFNPDDKERVFDFRFLVVKSLGQGSAYSLRESYDPRYLRSFIGKKIKGRVFDDIALEVAVYDSIYDRYQKNTPDAEYTLSGSSVIKSVQRAQIVFDECRRLLAGIKKPKVVNVGVVTNVVRKLRDNGYDVAGADFDPEIINKDIYKDVHVYPGSMTYDLVKESDLAVITGMTLTTDTIDCILEAAKANGTRVVVFAETASNLGDFFIDAGVDSFVSEPFPFYIFDGETKIYVKRKTI